MKVTPAGLRKVTVRAPYSTPRTIQSPITGTPDHRDARRPELFADLTRQSLVVPVGKLLVVERNSDRAVIFGNGFRGCPEFLLGRVHHVPQRAVVVLDVRLPLGHASDSSGKPVDGVFNQTCVHGACD